MGALHDVRVYGEGLSAEAVRELNATIHLPKWGGLDRERIGVWGERGAEAGPLLTGAFDSYRDRDGESALPLILEDCRIHR